MKKKLLLSTAILGMLTFAAGCNIVTSGNMEEQTIKVEKDEAKELEVQLNLGVGNLDVSSGAETWMEGNVRYNVDEMQPELSYDLSGETGRILMEQKETNAITGNIKNEWDLKLSKEIPMNLKVNSGASNTDLNLKGLHIKYLEVQAGVGELNVDLSGDWKESFDVKLETGVGDSTFVLPSNVGVRVQVEKGIGSTNIVGLISQGDGTYVNEAYEKSDILVDINSEMGIGKVTFKVSEK